MRLHGRGVASRRKAAIEMGISDRTLYRAFKAEGVECPWLQGGGGRGAGRRKNQVDISSQPCAGRESRGSDSHDSRHHDERDIKEAAVTDEHQPKSNRAPGSRVTRYRLSESLEPSAVGWADSVSGSSAGGGMLRMALMALNAP